MFNWTPWSLGEAASPTITWEAPTKLLATSFLSTFSLAAWWYCRFKQRLIIIDNSSKFLHKVTAGVPSTFLSFFWWRLVTQHDVLVCIFAPHFVLPVWPIWREAPTEWDAGRGKCANVITESDMLPKDYCLFPQKGMFGFFMMTWFYWLLRLNAQTLCTSRLRKKAEQGGIWIRN